MKIVIGNNTYTDIMALSFAPEADVTGSEVPINVFEADIKTDDEISIGGYAFLYDDLDNLWAKYWIVYAEHLDRHFLRLRAQSALKLLERRKLEPVMYNSEPVTDIFEELFDRLGVNSYVLDESFAEETITGFCPEQSAKTRLQWVCFVLGAYIKSFFSDKIEILPIDDTETVIPIQDTYWKPSVSYDDWVTALNVTAYSFQQGTPSSVDKWVTDGQNYYIVTDQNVSLSNSSAPQAAPVHEIYIDGVTLVNQTNVSRILSHLSQYYFKRMQVDLDVVNNAAYKPGDRVLVYTDQDEMASGFIGSADFTFGIQAKSKIHLTPVENRTSATLTIRYLYNSTQLGISVFTFPVGYEYRVENPYIDWTIGVHRYIFRPVNAAATGTMQSGENEDDENYQVALDSKEGTLRIISVDDVSQNDRNEVVIV